MDNAKDIAIIDTAEEQKAMGIAIAKGVLATLGIKYKEEKKLVSVRVDNIRLDNAEMLLKLLRYIGLDCVIV